ADYAPQKLSPGPLKSAMQPPIFSRGPPFFPLFRNLAYLLEFPLHVINQIFWQGHNMFQFFPTVHLFSRRPPRWFVLDSVFLFRYRNSFAFRLIKSQFFSTTTSHFFPFPSMLYKERIKAVSLIILFYLFFSWAAI